MKKLHFKYYMKIDYEIEVARCNFTIKCIPQNTKRQTICNTEIEMYPETTYSKGVDGLKNCQIYGLNELPHKSFLFQITGEAIVGNALYEEDENEDLSMIFRHPYGLSAPGETIFAYYKKICEELKGLISSDIFTKVKGNELVIAQAMMHCLYRDFSYRQYTTDVNTSAEEAFMQGQGVCQDYAHIFIALMHLCDIPARYVTGLIVGEGASHAWVEILQDHKWYGLDPTNDKVVDDEHIKIGIGRDARDCMINRGIMHGGGWHTQEIQVNVREIGVEEKND